MDFYKDPQGIERRSMEIIAPYLSEYNLTEEEIKVYSRVIHASGDPEYAPIIKIKEGAIAAGQQALKKGCKIYTDVEMVRTGINKRRLAQFGGEVKCLIADAGVAAMANKQQITRSMAAMRTFGRDLDGAIVAIGNAPTALFEVLNLIDELNIRPALIVGVPVGFVGAAESKEHLIDVSPVPYITVRGNKGGSPIAASIINAIMYMTK
jgi:precorrin-8X/cobalt-precorrin-8 methylmutase